MHYIILVLFFAFLLAKRKAGNTAYIFYTSILVLFAFFTREGSWDYYGYVNYYKCSINPSCESIGFEKSFSYVSQLTYFVSNSYGLELTLLVYIISSLTIKIYLIKSQSKAFGAAMLAFVCHAYFIHDLTQQRASLAIAILWISYSYWFDRKIFHWFCAIAFAAFFHVSALMGLLIVFIQRFSTKYLLILTIPSALLGQYLGNGGVASLPVLPFERLDVYLSALGSSALVSSQFNVYAFVITFIAFIGYKNGLEGWSNLERFGVNSMLFGVVVYLCSYFIPVVPVRLLEFFTCLYPFVFAATYSSSKSKIEKIALIVGVLGIFVNTVIRNNTRVDFVLPWQSINIDYMTESQLEQMMQFLQ